MSKASETWIAAAIRDSIEVATEEVWDGEFVDTQNLAETGYLTSDIGFTMKTGKQKFIVTVKEVRP